VATAFSVDHTLPTCTTITYTPWSSCQSNNTQTRKLISRTPSDCTDTPILSQSCSHNNHNTEGYKTYQSLKKQYFHPKDKAAYEKTKKLKKSDLLQYQNLRAIYNKYKKLSKRERTLYLDQKTQDLFDQYKSYKGYQRYKDYKKKYG